MANPLSNKTNGKNTREKLMDAALSLMAEDRSGLSGLSLRKITSRSGVSPPTFYGHFASTEELGLALVEEAGSTIRYMMREARQISNFDGIVRDSIAMFLEYVRANKPTFLLVVRERAGSSPAIRAAIRREISALVEEMAADFSKFQEFAELRLEDLKRIFNACIALGVHAIPDLLDVTGDGRAEVARLAADLDFQVHLLFAGIETANA